MISARNAARIWRMAYGVIKPAIESGLLTPQAIGNDLPGRVSYIAFACDYIDDVLAILGPERATGHTVLTEDVKENLRALNKKWKHKKVNSLIDAKKTKRFLEDLKANK
jgi:hypothetical protein